MSITVKLLVHQGMAIRRGFQSPGYSVLPVHVHGTTNDPAGKAAAHAAVEAVSGTVCPVEPKHQRDSIHLQPFGPDQMTGYVLYREPNFNTSPSSPFTEADVTTFYWSTQWVRLTVNAVGAPTFLGEYPAGIPGRWPDGSLRHHVITIPAFRFTVPVLLNASSLPTVANIRGYVNANTITICGVGFTAGRVLFEGVNERWVRWAGLRKCLATYTFAVIASGFYYEAIGLNGQLLPVAERYKRETFPAFPTS